MSVLLTLSKKKQIAVSESEHTFRSRVMYFQDLQKFLDEAKDGVIYFSLGSSVRSDHMPEEKRRVFIEVFSALPQKILWKWELDRLPGRPPNMKTGTWLPQQDILGNIAVCS